MLFAEAIEIDYQYHERIEFWDAFWDTGWIFTLGLFILAFALIFIAINVNEDFSTPANILTSTVSGVVTAVLIGGFVTSFICLDTNQDNRNSVKMHNTAVKWSAEIKAEKRVFEKYNLDEDSTLHFEHVIQGYTLTEVSTTYNDLESNNRYDLIFAFDKDGQPNLMKSAQVTDSLIDKLEK